MRFHAARSRLADGGDAAEEILYCLRAGGCESPDLLCLFVTSHHRESGAQIADRLLCELGPGVLAGCTCEGVIGVDEEIEREPGISVLAANLPGVELKPFSINPLDWNDALASDEVLETIVGAGLPARGCMLLADPFSTPIDALLSALDRLGSAGPIFGGMASGAYQQGGNALFLGDGMYTEGCVGVSFSGPVRIQTVVSQGCRPVGDRFLVTNASENIILGLNGRPALEAARQVIEEIRNEERSFGSELFLGVAMNEYQDRFGRGDFLVRNLVGGDPDSGAIVLGDHVRPGQTVQFQVRDADAATEDLRELLNSLENSAAAGALIFSCNGRGTRMFDRPCHDVRSVLDALPETPIGGFFAMGELGPVSGKSYVHGHTASIAVFGSEVGEEP